MAASEISLRINSSGPSPNASSREIRLDTVTGCPASSRATVASASGCLQSFGSSFRAASMFRFMRPSQSIAIRLSFHVLAVEECRGDFGAPAHPTMADSPRKGRDSAVTAHVRRFHSLRFAAEQATPSISELPPAEVDHLVGRAIREGWPASKLTEEIERRIERRKTGGIRRTVH